MVVGIAIPLWAAVQLSPAQVRALVAQLASLKLSNAPLSVPQAAWIKTRLAQLADTGTNAVPAIQDFLARNQDLYFDSPGSAALVGAPSLRVALFELLGSLGSPPALALLKSSLRSTADPVELATLARLIERAEPTRHHAEFAGAARDTLTLAATGKWDGRDVAPLFEMLLEFGGTNVAPELERHAERWIHYAPLMLLHLPESAGIPALLRLARKPEAGTRAGRPVYLRLLAETALAQASAADELHSQTRTDKIEAGAWPGIAAALEGKTLQLVNPILTEATATNTPLLVGGAGQEQVREIPPPDSASANELGQRIRLVDRLLEATSNPAALDALEAARIHLSERLSRIK